MIRLEPIQGVTYTNNNDNLPIEERVFFREGLVANASDYRPATEAELQAWREYQAKQEEEMKLMDTSNEQM